MSSLSTPTSIQSARVSQSIHSKIVNIVSQNSTPSYYIKLPLVGQIIGVEFASLLMGAVVTLQYRQMVRAALVAKLVFALDAYRDQSTRSAHRSLISGGLVALSDRPGN